MITPPYMVSMNRKPLVRALQGARAMRAATKRR
jgi:hypothetical protein